MEISKFALKIAKTIKEHKLLEPRSKVLVCVSGGADSVALLLSLHELGYICTAAHCNFALRGKESDDDQLFVAQLCKSLDISLVTTRFNVTEFIDNHKGTSVEMACRELRYEWFYDICESLGCNAIAVGHNFNDREETFMLNAMRGTGIRGLASIKYRNNNVIRPLLDATRTEIIDYLASRDQTYRTDSTNLANDYERNKVRNILLPSMNELFPGNALHTTVKNMSSAGEFYDFAISFFSKQVTFAYDTDSLVIQFDALKKFPGYKTLLHEIISNYGFNQSQLTNIIDASQGAEFLSETHRAEINRGTIIISPIEIHDTGFRKFILAPECKLPTGYSIRFTKFTKGFKFATDNRSLYLNADIIGHEITIRHWKKGDIIYPYGMKGRKRLVSDLFNDSKLSPLEKRTQPIFECEGNIIWIPGIRASQFYSVCEGDDMVVITNPSL